MAQTPLFVVVYWTTESDMEIRNRTNANVLGRVTNLAELRDAQKRKPKDTWLGVFEGSLQQGRFINDIDEVELALGDFPEIPVSPGE